MHTCPMVTGVVPHVGGPILPPGHPTTMIGGLPAARVGDLVTCAGPPDTIVRGSPTVLIGNMPAARMGDNTAHGGVITVGHPTTLIGEAGAGGGGGGGGAGGGGGGNGGDGPGASQAGPQDSAATSSSIDITSVQAALQTAADSGTALVEDPPPDETAEEPTSTFEVKVVWDATNEPVSGVELIITLPDGEEVEQATNAEGKVEIPDLDESGTCQVTSDIADASVMNTLDYVSRGAGAEARSSDSNAPAPQAPEPAGGGWRIAEMSEHKVKKGESLKSLAQAAGLTWQELARFNFGTEEPREINEHLRDDVGCTKLTRDGHNYMFDDSDEPGLIYIPREWRASGLQTDVEHVIRVNAAKAPALLRVIMKSETTGHLLAARRLVVFDKNDVEIARGETNEHGEAVIGVPQEDTYYVAPEDPGVFSVSGTVLERGTLIPKANATVEVRPWESDSYTVQTDTSGKLSLSDVPGGELILGCEDVEHEIYVNRNIGNLLFFIPSSEEPDEGVEEGDGI